MLLHMDSQPEINPQLSPKVTPMPELDPRFVETIDFSDPNELAKLLDTTDEEKTDE